MKYKKAMKDFEKLSEEEQNEVILNIASKLTGQEIWYWEGIVHKLRTLQEENKQLETTLNAWAEVAKDEEKRKYEFMEKNKKAIGIANERINYCYNSNDKEQLESWQELFDVLQGSDKE